MRSARDVWLAAAATLVMLGQVAIGRPAEASGLARAVATAALLLAGLALVWRRRYPIAVAATAVAASVVQAVAVGPVLPLAGWAGFLVIFRYVPRYPYALAATAVVVAGSTAGALIHDRTGALATIVLLTITVTLAAALARAYVDRTASQRREAATEERLRIARELHDVVGHGLSAIAVQSSTARIALDNGDEPAARNALGAVEAASRGALTEMRDLLGVLREESARSIESLGDGRTVTVTREGPAAPMPPATALAAYRIAQEGITNATKHAPGATVSIHVRQTAGQLTVVVTDTGSTTMNEAEGYGLLGLKERVEALGGTFHAGPRTDATGWRIEARLPLPRGQS